MKEIIQFQREKRQLFYFSLLLLLLLHLFTLWEVKLKSLQLNKTFWSLTQKVLSIFAQLMRNLANMAHIGALSDQNVEVREVVMKMDGAKVQVIAANTIHVMLLKPQILVVESVLMTINVEVKEFVKTEVAKGTVDVHQLSNAQLRKQLMPMEFIHVNLISNAQVLDNAMTTPLVKDTVAAHMLTGVILMRTKIL